VYGPGHAYANPGGGLGRESVVASLSRQALSQWHATWFQPGSATLVVAGDVTMAQLMPELQKTFGDWKAGTAPAKSSSIATSPGRGKVYLIDKPGAPQSVIVAAELATPSGSPDDLALETVMRNFGGMATSRMNRNLRLDKHWSYGTQGGLTSARGPRVFQVIAPVQTDKTRESMVETMMEIRGIAGARPLAGEEYASIMRSQVARLPGRFETLDSLLNAALDVVNTGRPPEYYYNYTANLQGLQPAALNAAAANVVKPENLTWIVIGDLSKVEAGIRELNIGDVVKIKAE
jgi:zinc protease